MCAAWERSTWMVRRRIVWILKVDDTKLLSRIDYIYVTDSPHKVSAKPHAKPLLSASLAADPNQP